MEQTYSERQILPPSKFLPQTLQVIELIKQNGATGREFLRVKYQTEFNTRLQNASLIFQETDLHMVEDTYNISQRINLFGLLSCFLVNAVATIGARCYYIVSS